MRYSTLAAPCWRVAQTTIACEAPTCCRYGPRTSVIVVPPPPEPFDSGRIVESFVFPGAVFRYV